MSQLSLAILQRVCTRYRRALFRRLAARPDLRVRLFIGDDLPGSKVRSAPDLGDLDVVRLPTRWLSLPPRWLRLGGRVLPIHRGLEHALDEFAPDVILSEGDSHLLGFLTAARFRDRKRNRALVHWGLGGLPGEVHPRLSDRLKKPLQAKADALLCYSSFGAEVLSKIGHPRDKIAVAVNVCDTELHLWAADSLSQTRAEARAEVGLAERFTAIAVGALDANKRVDVLIEAFAGLDSVNLVLAGAGPERAALQQRARQLGAHNLYFTGALSPDALPLYYRAADVLLLPGRGGMVISEAMAHGLPVVVYQADGTEFDLVQDGVTGLRLHGGEADDFRSATLQLAGDPAAAARMGAAGRRLIETDMNLDTMIDRIVEACQLARARRTAMPSS